MDNNTVRVRFAPSPTGYLHVGGARSALFNYLFAKRYGGTFILRIEDTDRSRFVEDALTEIYESMRWMGILWDEGPEVGGAYGPYIQSERLDLYKQASEELIAKGHAYRCFCSSQRLEDLRAVQEKEKGKLGYDGHCRNLTVEQVEANLKAGMPHVVRFKIPSGQTIVFKDLVRGAIEYQSDTLDDFVLLKTDTFPTYHLANVVDDHHMKISHVLRGDEWISSTPRHVLLYRAFGWQHPEFVHLPLILSSDGGKLSKRKGAASVLDYKKAGYLPETLMNFLALLGWAPGGDREKMSCEEMISLFALEQISPKASVFDEKKLEWMNGQYMAERPLASMVEEVRPLFVDAGYVNAGEALDEGYFTRVVDLLRTRSKKLTELVAAAEYFYRDPVVYEEKAAKKHFTPDAAAILQTLHEKLAAAGDYSEAALESIVTNAAESMGIQLGKIIHPIRLAVSGVSVGPGLYELLSTLGKARVTRRIASAVTYLTAM